MRIFDKSHKLMRQIRQYLERVIARGREARGKIDEKPGADTGRGGRGN